MKRVISITMKKGLILLGLSCTGFSGAIAKPDSPPLITGGKFDDGTNSELGLLARGNGVQVLGDTNFRIDLPLPDLSKGDGDIFVLGMDCDIQHTRICGGNDLRCYSCTAYGVSRSGLPEDFVKYRRKKVKALRCTAVIAAKDSYISGVVTDPRGYKYQIDTLLLPGYKQDPLGYGYEGIIVQDWNISMEKIVPRDPERSKIPIDPVVDHRALRAEENHTPKNGSRVSPKNVSSQIGRAKADDDGSTITLMYYLTKRAMCQWTNQAYAKCKNNPAALVPMVGVVTTFGNLVLANSNIDYVFETVHIYVDEEHDEGTSATTRERLDWITGSETAARLRDKYGADLVVEVHYMDPAKGAGGIARVPRTFPAREIGFSSQGGKFQLINEIIVHEIGHTMGLNHNREQEGGGLSDKSYYGYNNCDECFMTIMSYKDHCEAQGCRFVTEIPYFSNVDVKYTNNRGTFAMGNARNDNSATLNLSRVGVAMHRFKAPQLLLESPRFASYYGFVGPEYLVFSVIAKDNVEVNNLEFIIGGAMEIELYTATGSFHGKEWNDAFWGDPHVAENVVPMSDANPLLNLGFAAFESFPTLTLSKGSTTSFKIKHETTNFMEYASANQMALGDVFFKNNHLQITVGAFGGEGYVYTNPASLQGALRYTVGVAEGNQKTKCIANARKVSKALLVKIRAQNESKMRACSRKRGSSKTICQTAQKIKFNTQISKAAGKMKRSLKACALVMVMGMGMGKQEKKCTVKVGLKTCEVIHKNQKNECRAKARKVRDAFLVKIRAQHRTKMKVCTRKFRKVPCQTAQKTRRNAQISGITRRMDSSFKACNRKFG